MMKLIPVFALLCMTIISCSKEEEPGPVPASIKAIIDNSNDCTCLPYINQYEWKGQTIYVLAFRGPACNWTPGYFDKNGQPVFMAIGYPFDQFLVESLLIRVVWECE